MNLLWEDRVDFEISPCRAASVQRESTLVLGTQSGNGTPVDAVTRTGSKRTSGRPILGLSKGNGHGVIPESDCGR